MPSFEIPDIPAKAQLKQETENNQTISTGAVTFTVTNKTGQGLSGRVTIEPQGEAKAEWFSIDGESERQFTAGVSRFCFWKKPLSIATGNRRKADFAGVPLTV